MALTLASLKNHVKHALGGEPAVIVSSADATKQQFVNEAGRFLCAMHDWKFLERAPTALSLTASQQYVALPTGFGQLIAAAAINSVGCPFEMTTFDAIANMRANVVTVTGKLWAAIVHPAQANQTSAPPVPRLELYPTPSDSITDAITIFYRAGWTELTDDTHLANIPLYTEALLVQLVRAFARGYEEDQLDDLVDRVVGGQIAQRAIEYDGAVQPDYGPIEGGAVQTAGVFRQYQASTVPDP